MATTNTDIRIPSYLSVMWRSKNRSEPGTVEFTKLCELIGINRPLDENDTPSWVRFQVHKALTMLAKSAEDATSLDQSAGRHLRLKEAYELAALFNLANERGPEFYKQLAKG